MSERACGVVWTDEKETWHLKMGVVLVSEPAYPSFDDSFFVVFFGPFLAPHTNTIPFLSSSMLPGEWRAATDDEWAFQKG